MRKTILSAIIMAAILVSCHQKNNVATPDHSQMMGTDGTMVDNDSTLMNNNNTMMNSNTKMMDNPVTTYACPMHPEVHGKRNDKCSKCGMKLTEPVTEKTAASK